MYRTWTIAIVTGALLAGCASTVHVDYRLTMKEEDPAKLADLSLASLRIVERRMQNLGEEVRGLDITQEADGPRLSFTTETQAAADLLEQELTTPFAFSIMRAARGKETPEIAVESHGGFLSTGINEQHLSWVSASVEPDSKGRITLHFTDEGRKLMRKMFKENVGKQIGLFVRKKLVAALQVDTAELKDDIIITGIPSAELARVFADDVNVGLHVTFTPLP